MEIKDKRPYYPCNKGVCFFDYTNKICDNNSDVSFTNSLTPLSKLNKEEFFCVKNKYVD